ncbi:protein-glutamate O-methyltransferase [Brevundimonas vitis]|uniref:Chemotaxis protein methyltransferase n=1 Tax=Brevundimonas vitisensis TaxID=2800818 RepID=A0ABX7BL00_9CAUL|nr:protein-glutamate O-methyltransferase [Brevundimonas vitisensis]QQQ18100.1 protein-glutamate O-methyltransferase [Brevundimonas vitisensis]
MSALRKASLVDGEFSFTQDDFRIIADTLYAASGIALPPSKATLVYSRLGKRLRALGLSCFRDYCAVLDGPDGEQERSALLSALTTNVTRFFREPHHFDALRDQFRRHLGPLAASGGRVRLWSAGCSLGHEPYSIAMTVLSELPNAADLDVRILATDIDPQVIETAKQGRYSEDDLSPVPAEMAARGISRARGQMALTDDVRRLVRFGVLNLHETWPMKGPFDVIFCRNVAIYFDDQTQKRLWSRFGQALTPRGQLYIGHSERAEAPELQPDGLTIYRRRSA